MNSNRDSRQVGKESSVSERPIFVTGLSRGGTTILMNLLASHPDVCTLGEIHQLFKGSSVMDSYWQVAVKATLRDLPVILSSRQDLLSPRNRLPRRPIPRWTARFIRAVLARAKKTSFHDHLNKFKRPGVPYTREEIDAAFLLGKNLDGMVFLSDLWQELFPKCRFVGLLRNGFAFCEGHVRRGRSARDAGLLYRTVVERMLSDAERFPQYEVIRFEELLVQPLSQLRGLLSRLGLDPQRLQHIRIQDRRRMNHRGEHLLLGEKEWEVRWLPVHQLASYVDPAVDENQIRLLSDRDRNEFLREAGECMERLGYAMTPRSERLQVA